jgi:Domain of unknown function (DUF4365)
MSEERHCTILRTLELKGRPYAARAGVTCGDLGQDYGIDVCLRGIQEVNGSYFDSGPQLDLQLRTTAGAEVREQEILYDIDVRSYNVLRLQHVCPPRILVLLLLPEDEQAWMSQTAEELILCNCAYWISLRAANATTNEATFRLRISRGNVFSPEAVLRFLEDAQRGNRP